MRAPIVFPIRVASGTHVVQTTTREVSVDGVFICALRPPKPGTQISLKLYLPGSSQVEEVAAVVREWRSSPDGGYWAEFVNLQRSLHDAITNLLERRARAAAAGPGVPIGALAMARKGPGEDPRRAFPRGGIFIQTDNPPELHSVVMVTMELPDGGAPVDAQGRVVHRVLPREAKERKTTAGAGVQFIDSTDGFRERIDRTIEFILKEA